MKILWFANSPSLAGKHLSKSITLGRSWIEALEQKFITYDGIELCIAFNWDTPEFKSFKIDGHPTQYYMIPANYHGKYYKYYRRLTKQPPYADKPIEYYLRVINEFKPDIIQFFGTESIFSLLLPLIEVPSVIWFQGNLTVYQTKWEAGIKLKYTRKFESLNERFKGNSFTNQHAIYSKLVQREQVAFRHATNFMGRTNWDKRLVSVMAPQANYHHCEEAMRKQFYENKWEPPKGNQKYIIFSTIIGWLYKGLETVFEASKLLENVLGPNSIEWRIAGVKPGSTYAKVAKYKADLEIGSGNVVLLGFQSADQLVEELLNSNVYVHPSHIENSPNSVCEAMLLGMPVVATNVGGTPSLLKDEEEGLLVQSGDSYATAGAVLEILRNQEWAAQMGEKARARGLKRNDRDAICDRVLEIYKDILK